MNEFLHMDGYAFYVWSSYGLATAVLAWIFLGPLFGRRRIIADLTRKARRARREES